MPFNRKIADRAHRKMSHNGVKFRNPVALAASLASQFHQDNIKAGVLTLRTAAGVVEITQDAETGPEGWRLEGFLASASNRPDFVPTSTIAVHAGDNTVAIERRGLCAELNAREQQELAAQIEAGVPKQIGAKATT